MDVKTPFKNEGKIMIFPAKQKPSICQQKTLTKRTTKKSNSGRSKMIQREAQKQRNDNY
jgi:hypothetical protein